MIPYFQYAKWAAIAGLLFWIWHAGGAHQKAIDIATLEREHAAMAEAATQALLAQRKAQEAETARLKHVEDAYDAIKDIPDPATVGTAHRLLIRASGADCAVSGPNPVATGIEAPTPQPIGPSRVESALNAVLVACAADAAQMSAMIELAP